MELRIPELMWPMEEEAADTGLVERLEAQVEVLNRKVGRLERRQQRFADMIRLLLSLHDQTSARLTALDGGMTSSEEAKDLADLPTETGRTTESELLSRPVLKRRAGARRGNP